MLTQNFRKWIIPALLISCFCLILSWQEIAETKGNAVPSRPNYSIDTAFVGKNMRDNKMEIELSELAVKRSTNEQVRKAAQQMITDHTQILNDLAKIAQNNSMLALVGYPTDGGGGGTGTDGNNSIGVDRTVISKVTRARSSSSKAAGPKASGKGNNNNAVSTNTGSYNNLGTTGTTTAKGTSNANKTKNNQTGSSNSGGHMAMEGNNNDSMMRQSMSALLSASGAAFDKLWIPHMLGSHEAKLAELTAVVNTINDSDLKTVVKTAIPKIKRHRDMLLSLTESGNIQ